MRCQVSDNFAFGSSVDKTLIYTDEMWFTTNNVEEAKCILKCTKTYIRAERKNTKACRLVTQNHGALLCKKKTPLKTDFSTMRQDNQWRASGKWKLRTNPLMWLRVWNKYIAKYIEDNYMDELNTSIRCSVLWNNVKTLQLLINMRSRLSRYQSVNYFHVINKQNFMFQNYLFSASIITLFLL